VFLKDCQKAWGKAAQGWAVGADCVGIQGFLCDNSGMIYSISLMANLNGSIPDSISSLIALTYLDLSSNNVMGSIPNGISKLSQLYHLDISNNNLRGSISSDIPSLPQLIYL
ncbi:unnamed protein product, partial [Closterium sp. NIES-54]